MLEKETLHFKIGVSGTHWDKQPQWVIRINGDDVAAGQSGNEIDYVEFDHQLLSGPNLLEILLTNKTDADTVENADKTAIVKDMLLNIHSVEIDEIDLGQVIRTHSEFVGADQSRPRLKNCVNLGWNGTWQLPFASPFYLWLLENM